MSRRRYSDEERAACLAALAANSGDVRKTARECGVPETTLRQWRDGSRHPEATQMSESKKPALADLFEAFARQVLELTGEAEIKAAPLNQRFTAAGIAIDKARLLRGETTADVRHRTDPRELSDDALLDLIADHAGPGGGGTAGEEAGA